MIFPARRLDALAHKMETGERVTVKDLETTAALQALDVARAGRDFVEQWVAAEEKHTAAAFAEPTP